MESNIGGGDGGGGGGAAYYVNTASMAQKPQAAPVIVEHQTGPRMSPDPNYYQGGQAGWGGNGAQQGAYGGAYGPTSPVSNHSSEMYVPQNQGPPRYASPPVYGHGPPGQGQYNEVAGVPVPDRYELHH